MEGGEAWRLSLDYNQNAKDRTTASAHSVRPLPDARVSAPLHWHEVSDCDPADFTVFTMPKRFAESGDPHALINTAAGSLELLLDLAARDEAAGLGDAPWPPHFRKAEGEAVRVSPSRAKAASISPSAKKAASAKGSANRPRTKMPLLVIANSPSESAAQEGLDRWKKRYPEAAEHLAADDVLVDRMRGRSSTWTRIRVNLRHVPVSSGLRRKRPIRMTIQPENGEKDYRKARMNDSQVSARSRKSAPVRAALQLRAAHRYNRPGSYLPAIS